MFRVLQPSPTLKPNCNLFYGVVEAAFVAEFQDALGLELSPSQAEVARQVNGAEGPLLHLRALAGVGKTTVLLCLLAGLAML